MKNSIKSVFTIALVSSLVGCVKVRNPDDEKKPEANVIETKVGDVTVNGPMYIYRGNILSAEDYQHQKDRKDSEQTDFTDITINMDRLTFQPGGVLYTMGKKVRIQVQDLKSTGGKIATFPENQTAVLGRDGRSGGHIQLLAQLAVGDLQIEMRGEIGGQGATGPKPVESMKGATGPDGVLERVRNGNSGIIFCREAANGGRGGQGSKGQIGGVGMRGGDTGTLELNLQDASMLDYKVTLFPGAGGRGGNGGEGGKGGDGGKPVACASKHGGKGPTGPTGDSGDRGSSGPVGQQQTYCVIISGTMTCSN
jgi:hypothetical protein